MSKFTMLYDETGKKSVKAYQPCIVDDTVKLGKNVEIGAFSVLEAHTEIGANAKIGALCYIAAGSKVEAEAEIPPLSFIGDKKAKKILKKILEKT